MSNYDFLTVSQLIMDRHNPRIPRALRNDDEVVLIRYMWKKFGLEDLIISINKNGYIDAEPLMVIQEDEASIYTVVEGNRRLAALKVLTDEDVRAALPELSKKYPLKIDIVKEIPCVVYSNRDDVANALAVRHISGIKKWETREKAEFISSLYDSLPDKTNGIKEIMEIIGSRSDKIGATLFAYRWVNYIIEKEGNDLSEFFENRLSLLILALGQSSIKEFVGIKNLKWQDVNYDIASYDVEGSDVYENMKLLCSWLDDKSIIKDSRQITGQSNASLSRILECKSSRDFLVSSTLNGKPDFNGASLRIDVDRTLHIKFWDLKSNASDIVSVYKQYKSQNIQIEKEEIKSAVDQTIEILSHYDV